MILNLVAGIVILTALMVVAPVYATSWRYNARFLQAVSGVHLKGKFLAGYVNGTKLCWWNRGYAESSNKLPISYPHNTDYVEGYKTAI